MLTSVMKTWWRLSSHGRVLKVSKECVNWFNSLLSRSFDSPNLLCRTTVISFIQIYRMYSSPLHQTPLLLLVRQKNFMYVYLIHSSHWVFDGMNRTLNSSHNSAGEISLPFALSLNGFKWVKIHRLRSKLGFRVQRKVRVVGVIRVWSLLNWLV